MSKTKKLLQKRTQLETKLTSLPAAIKKLDQQIAKQQELENAALQLGFSPHKRSMQTFERAKQLYYLHKNRETFESIAASRGISVITVSRQFDNAERRFGQKYIVTLRWNDDIIANCIR